MDSEVYNEEEEAAACEDVRRMAQALGPQMSALNDILRDYSSVAQDESNLAAGSADDDDSMDGELERLLISEQSLREELEFAEDMNAMLSPSKDDNKEQEEGPHLETEDLDSIKQELNPGEDKAPHAYTLQDHADYLQIRTEKIGGWYYCDMSGFLLPSGSESKGLVKDYCLPVPFRKLKRLYIGLNFQDVSHSKKVPLSTPAKLLQTPTPATPVRQETPGKTPSRASLTSLSPSRTQRTSQTPNTPKTPAAPPPPPPPMPQEEPLPVRTVAIRIRCDVLCGAVMDAVHHAFEVLPHMTHILKRQGGHLRGAVYHPTQQLAYVADVQLCTQKNERLERRLMVRYYHVQDDPEAMNELGQALQQSNSNSSESSSNALETISGGTNTNHDEKILGNWHMKQSCSLIQRLMAAQQQGGANKMDPKQQSSWLGLRDFNFETRGAMQKAIGNHLLSNFKACPSVREENKKATPTIRRLTLPSLSNRDWPLLELSWELTTIILDELDTRDCTYNTLSTLPFGQFPSLPTLDVHYCSQLRRLSRESMITQLLKSAKELEDYAKTAEYNCAICITLLEPMFKFYGIAPLGLPDASKSLDEYTLDFTPPQIACPPWGILVSEALNKVASKTPTGEIAVDDAVRMVYQAFTKQDDEEQAARLGRKNAQIMDRLAKLQSHQRSLIQCIRDSHVYSAKARTEADDFHNRAQAATNDGKEGYPLRLGPAVPLLRFRISLGASSSGDCYVTSNQILFATRSIPIVGSTTTTVFDLSIIDFQVIEGVTSSLLNPYPHTMGIVLKRTKQMIYSFRPAIGPSRLQKFFSVIQSFVGDDGQSEFSPVVGNMQLVEEDGVLRLSGSQSDELSI
eukprot:scaffold345_cov134-Cylindrotheca_fusiformis.AAC.3